MNRIKIALFGYVVPAGFYFLLLAFLGGFSVRQSVVVALLFLLFVHRMNGFAQRPTHRLHPYRVCIAPKLRNILHDFRLVQSAEEWRQIQYEVEKTPDLNYIWQYGISFTVLAQEDAHMPLTSFHNRNAFVTGTSFREFIYPFHLPRTSKSPNLLEHETVSVFVRPNTGGYEFGISVPDRWWREMRDSCPKPEKECGAGSNYDLVLVTIPHNEFTLYREQIERGDDWFETTQWMYRVRDECRRNLGWKAGSHPPYQLDHQYFRLSHYAI